MSSIVGQLITWGGRKQSDREKRNQISLRYIDFFPPGTMLASQQVTNPAASFHCPETATLLVMVEISINRLVLSESTPGSWFFSLRVVL